MNIDIIGAGIGGLTTALALEQKGIETRVFEQANQLKPVGAGIILANNAMQVFKKLGLRKVIEEAGNPISKVNITSSDLRPISGIDLSYFEQKYHTKNIAIHRGKLQQILLKNLKSTKIHLDHKLQSIVEHSNGYELNFEKKGAIQSSTIIGADGINSAVRQQLFPNNTIRNAKQICWRGVTEFNLPLKYKNELNEAWGKSERFGFVQISENKVYWFAVKSFEKNRNQYDIKDLVQYFSDFHEMIREIISSTKVEQIYTDEISDLKPTNIWFKDTVCLIGDAAHATTPNMGQGACQAIEDANVISECLSKYDTLKAFSEFQKLRLPKAHKVVKTSWLIGRIAHISNPILIKLRNAVLKMIPPSVNRKQNESLFKLDKV